MQELLIGAAVLGALWLRPPAVRHQLPTSSTTRPAAVLQLDDDDDDFTLLAKSADVTDRISNVNGTIPGRLTKHGATRDREAVAHSSEEEEEDTESELDSSDFDSNEDDDDASSAQSVDSRNEWVAACDVEDVSKFWPEVYAHALPLFSQRVAQRQLIASAKTAGSPTKTVNGENSDQKTAGTSAGEKVHQRKAKRGHRRPVPVTPIVALAAEDFCWPPRARVQKPKQASSCLDTVGSEECQSEKQSVPEQLEFAAPLPSISVGQSDVGADSVASPTVQTAVATPLFLQHRMRSHDRSMVTGDVATSSVPSSSLLDDSRDRLGGRPGGRGRGLAGSQHRSSSWERQPSSSPWDGSHHRLATAPLVSADSTAAISSTVRFPTDAFAPSRHVPHHAPTEATSFQKPEPSGALDLGASPSALAAKQFTKHSAGAMFNPLQAHNLHAATAAPQNPTSLPMPSGEKQKGQNGSLKESGGLGVGFGSSGVTVTVSSFTRSSELPEVDLLTAAGTWPVVPTTADEAAQQNGTGVVGFGLDLGLGLGLDVQAHQLQEQEVSARVSVGDEKVLLINHGPLDGHEQSKPPAATTSSFERSTMSSMLLPSPTLDVEWHPGQQRDAFPCAPKEHEDRYLDDDNEDEEIVHPRARHASHLTSHSVAGADGEDESHNAAKRSPSPTEVAATAHPSLKPSLRPSPNSDDSFPSPAVIRRSLQHCPPHDVKTNKQKQNNDDDNDEQVEREDASDSAYRSLSATPVTGAPRLTTVGQGRLTATAFHHAQKTNRAGIVETVDVTVIDDRLFDEIKPETDESAAVTPTYTSPPAPQELTSPPPNAVSPTHFEFLIGQMSGHVSPAAAIAARRLRQQNNNSNNNNTESNSSEFHTPHTVDMPLRTFSSPAATHSIHHDNDLAIVAITGQATVTVASPHMVAHKSMGRPGAAQHLSTPSALGCPPTTHTNCPESVTSKSHVDALPAVLTVPASMSPDRPTRKHTLLRPVARRFSSATDAMAWQCPPSEELIAAVASVASTTARSTHDLSSMDNLPAAMRTRTVSACSHHSHHSHRQLVSEGEKGDSLAGDGESQQCALPRPMHSQQGVLSRPIHPGIGRDDHAEETQGKKPKASYDSVCDAMAHCIPLPACFTAGLDVVAGAHLNNAASAAVASSNSEIGVASTHTERDRSFSARERSGSRTCSGLNPLQHDSSVDGHCDRRSSQRSARQSLSPAEQQLVRQFSPLSFQTPPQGAKDLVRQRSSFCLGSSLNESHAGMSASTADAAAASQPPLVGVVPVHTGTSAFTATRAPSSVISGGTPPKVREESISSSNAYQRQRSWQMAATVNDGHAMSSTPAHASPALGTFSQASFHTPPQGAKDLRPKNSSFHLGSSLNEHVPSAGPMAMGHASTNGALASPAFPPRHLDRSTTSVGRVVDGHCPRQDSSTTQSSSALSPFALVPTTNSTNANTGDTLGGFSQASFHTPPQGAKDLRPKNSSFHLGSSLNEHYPASVSGGGRASRGSVPSPSATRRHVDNSSLGTGLPSAPRDRDPGAQRSSRPSTAAVPSSIPSALSPSALIATASAAQQLQQNDDDTPPHKSAALAERFSPASFQTPPQTAKDLMGRSTSSFRLGSSLNDMTPSAPRGRTGEDHRERREGANGGGGESECSRHDRAGNGSWANSSARPSPSFHGHLPTSEDVPRRASSERSTCRRLLPRRAFTSTPCDAQSDSTAMETPVFPRRQSSSDATTFTRSESDRPFGDFMTTPGQQRTQQHAHEQMSPQASSVGSVPSAPGSFALPPPTATSRLGAPTNGENNDTSTASEFPTSAAAQLGAAWSLPFQRPQELTSEKLTNDGALSSAGMMAPPSSALPQFGGGGVSPGVSDGVLSGVVSGVASTAAPASRALSTAVSHAPSARTSPQGAGPQSSSRLTVPVFGGHQNTAQSSFRVEQQQEQHQARRKQQQQQQQQGFLPPRYPDIACHPRNPDGVSTPTGDTQRMLQHHCAPSGRPVRNDIQREDDDDAVQPTPILSTPVLTGVQQLPPGTDLGARATGARPLRAERRNDDDDDDDDDIDFQGGAIDDFGGVKKSRRGLDDGEFENSENRGVGRESKIWRHFTPMLCGRPPMPDSGAALQQSYERTQRAKFVGREQSSATAAALRSLIDQPMPASQALRVNSLPSPILSPLRQEVQFVVPSHEETQIGLDTNLVDPHGTGGAGADDVASDISCPTLNGDRRERQRATARTAEVSPSPTVRVKQSSVVETRTVERWVRRVRRSRLFSAPTSRPLPRRPHRCFVVLDIDGTVLSHATHLTDVAATIKETLRGGEKAPRRGRRTESNAQATDHHSTSAPDSHLGTANGAGAGATHCSGGLRRRDQQQSQLLSDGGPLSESLCCEESSFIDLPFFARFVALCGTAGHFCRVATHARADFEEVSDTAATELYNDLFITPQHHQQPQQQREPRAPAQANSTETIPQHFSSEKATGDPRPPIGEENGEDQPQPLVRNTSLMSLLSPSMSYTGYPGGTSTGVGAGRFDVRSSGSSRHASRGASGQVSRQASRQESRAHSLLGSRAMSQIGSRVTSAATSPSLSAKHGHHPTSAFPPPFVLNSSVEVDANDLPANGERYRGERLHGQRSDPLFFGRSSVASDPTAVSTSMDADHTSASDGCSFRLGSVGEKKTVLSTRRGRGRGLGARSSSHGFFSGGESAGGESQVVTPSKPIVRRRQRCCSFPTSPQSPPTRGFESNHDESFTMESEGTSPSALMAGGDGQKERMASSTSQRKHLVSSRSRRMASASSRVEPPRAVRDVKLSLSSSGSLARGQKVDHHQSVNQSHGDVDQNNGSLNTSSRNGDGDHGGTATPPMPVFMELEAPFTPPPASASSRCPTSQKRSRNGDGVSVASESMTSFAGLSTTSVVVGRRAHHCNIRQRGDEGADSVKEGGARNASFSVLSPSSVLSSIAIRPSPNNQQQQKQQEGVTSSTFGRREQTEVTSSSKVPHSVNAKSGVASTSSLVTDGDGTLSHRQEGQTASPGQAAGGGMHCVSSQEFTTQLVVLKLFRDAARLCAMNANSNSPHSTASVAFSKSRTRGIERPMVNGHEGVDAPQGSPQRKQKSSRRKEFDTNAVIAQLFKQEVTDVNQIAAWPAPKVVKKSKQRRTRNRPSIVISGKQQISGDNNNDDDDSCVLNGNDLPIRKLEFLLDFDDEEPSEVNNPRSKGGADTFKSGSVDVPLLDRSSRSGLCGSRSTLAATVKTTPFADSTSVGPDRNKNGDSQREFSSIPREGPLAVDDRSTDNNDSGLFFTKRRSGLQCDDDDEDDCGMGRRAQTYDHHSVMKTVVPPTTATTAGHSEVPSSAIAMMNSVKTQHIGADSQTLQKTHNDHGGVLLSHLEECSREAVAVQDQREGQLQLPPHRRSLSDDNARSKLHDTSLDGQDDAERKAGKNSHIEWLLDITARSGRGCFAPYQVLLIDDDLRNVEAAAAVGYHAFHCPKGLTREWVLSQPLLVELLGVAPRDFYDV